MKVQRVYIDTSAIGGCEDDEFRDPSLALLRDANLGLLRLVVSDHMLEQLAGAPAAVRRHLAELDVRAMEAVAVDAECRSLRDKYLSAGVVGPASASDALHVAIATVTEASLLASWNFRHIVHYDKARQFNAVNLREGYGLVEIRSPVEIALP